jgi:hypothetical protein
MISAAALLVPAVLSGRDRLWAAIIAVVVIARHTGNVVRRLPQARGGA